MRKKFISKEVKIGFMVTILGFVLIFGGVSVLNANYNKQLIDTNYKFNKAIIDLGNEVITVDVKSWTDYDNSTDYQIITKDGEVYLTNLNKCVLIYSPEE